MAKGIEIHWNDDALKQLERQATENMRKSDFDIECVNCKAKVKIVRGSGTCPTCGQAYKV